MKETIISGLEVTCPKCKFQIEPLIPVKWEPLERELDIEDEPCKYLSFRDAEEFKGVCYNCDLHVKFISNTGLNVQVFEQEKNRKPDLEEFDMYARIGNKGNFKLLTKEKKYSLVWADDPSLFNVENGEAESSL